MIILDTNVLSEPLKPRPEPRVVRWLDAQAPTTLFLTTINIAEMRFGIASLPQGRRHDVLRARFEDLLLPSFGGRVLAFDEPAAAAYAELRAQARARGRASADFDALVAGIAGSRGFAVATRDGGPFISLGVDVIDPWAD